MQSKKKILFSGIQPSGDLTLGNFLGAIKNWTKMQHDYDCIICVADLHAITVRQDPKIFFDQRYSALALNIACGIDPSKSLVFMQSQVPEHTQLSWVLNCYTQVGELNRMTQFKEKAKKYAHNINAGLFGYPVLQAADILLYQTNVVPVGKDQQQHIEITRDIALRFNNLYGEIFTVPELSLPSFGAKIMALQEPTKKMSKSDENKNNVIFLLDKAEDILNKFKRAVTDSEKSIHFDLEKKPGVANLLTILSLITGNTIAQLETLYQGQGYGKLKNDVADAVIACLAPMQKRYHELRADLSVLNGVLEHGRVHAIKRAAPTLAAVYTALGFVSAAK
ncbi:MAG: tryptophan--tRNA ligase [Gammaproteobacteria bacterium]|nr:tryptophan--tRNA ligase [Gammaproteobacteria bacterium]